MSKNKIKFQACILLHALGDTIGFKNGDWEFNYFQEASSKFSDDMVFEFISLGGINDLDMKGWIVSDDTILHMETIKVLNNKPPTIDEFGNQLVDRFIDSMSNMAGRYVGNIIQKSVMMLHKGTSWKEIPYNYYQGGSGASMRTSAIGLAFYGPQNRDKLIAHAIEASRITHNSVTGYLGGLVSALFTAYAMEKVELDLWPFELIKFLESEQVEKYMEKTRGLKDYNRDKKEFIDYWKQYIELRFKGQKHDGQNRSMRLPFIRTQFYIDNFAFDKNNPNAGISGHDSVIIAYDALADARHNWEKLVIYAMLHAGDSDTTGSIAASWYGALYGFGDVPKYMFHHLEFKKELIAMAEKLYQIYGYQ